MKILITAEGSEENLDLLLLIAKKFDIKISHPNKSDFLKLERKSHENAYAPWTTEDDDNLELLYVAGKKIKELATIFGRNEGAILSRMKKLELIEKYGKI